MIFTETKLKGAFVIDIDRRVDERERSAPRLRLATVERHPHTCAWHVPEWLTVERHCLHARGQGAAWCSDRSPPFGRGHVLLPRHVCSTHEIGRW